jgi:hypothetical protein
MELFHVSNKMYVDCQEIEITRINEYCKEKISNGFKNIEKILLKNKPDSAPSRLNSIFAFEQIEYCGAFINTIKGRYSEPKFYKIIMDNPWRSPMALVDILTKQVDEEKLIKIAQEYWEPKEEWNFLEYFSKKMKIIERIEEPDLLYCNAFKGLYFDDVEKAKKLFLNN